MNNKTESKEITLIEIFVRFVLFVKRKFFIILIITAIGTAIGFIKGFVEKKKYENKVIGSSDIIPGSIIFQIINTLKLDFGTNLKSFSKQLELPIETTRKIEKFEIDTLIYANKYSFKIQLISTDSNACIVVNNAILNSISKNQYVSESFIFAQNQQKQMINELNLKIKELDSLQKFIRIAAYKDKSQITVINSYYSEYIDLIEKKQKVEKELQSTSRIITIYLDSTTIVPGKSLKMAIFGFFISLMLSFVIAFFTDLNKIIKKYS